jgi:hypothetical protein
VIMNYDSETIMDAGEAVVPCTCQALFAQAVGDRPEERPLNLVGHGDVANHLRLLLSLMSYGVGVMHHSFIPRWQ